MFFSIINETLTFITISPDASPDDFVELGYLVRDGVVDEGAETAMFTLLNRERKRHGLQPLALSFELRDLSRAYATEMFEQGFFSHYSPAGESPFDRMQESGIGFLAAGENLALAPNVTLAHEGLMNSPGHRANILSAEFGKVGIGVIDGGIYGQMYVQEFTN